jgi:predicted small lipoprotein YifL
MISVLLLTACGLKGPLYLPNDPTSASPAGGEEVTPQQSKEENGKGDQEDKTQEYRS